MKKIALIGLIPCMFMAMERSSHYSNTHKSLWAHPKDLVHGLYLADVTSRVNAPFRISSASFTVEYTEDETLLHILDAIQPLTVISPHETFKSNSIPIPFQQHASPENVLEAACLKVEHLMRPELYKYLIIARTLNNKSTVVQTYHEDNAQLPQHIVTLREHLDRPKMVTRVFVTILDEALQKLFAKTNTFTCS